MFSCKFLARNSYLGILEAHFAKITKGLKNSNFSYISLTAQSVKHCFPKQGRNTFGMGDCVNYITKMDQPSICII